MSNKNDVNLVYVWIGGKLPLWAYPSLKITKKLSGVKLVLITSRDVVVNFKFDEIVFIEDLEENFWGEVKTPYQNKVNFWEVTKKRFELLRLYMKVNRIEKIFHAEFDNIVFNIKSLSDKLDLLGLGFFCPRDSHERGIASLIYINDVSSLDEFSEIVKISPELNDMNLLGLLLTKSKNYFPLPTESSLLEGQIASYDVLNFNKTGGIFDAAALGQFLFGIDPRIINRPMYNGFQNENCIIDSLWDIKFNINMDCESNIEYGKYKVNLYNLHIHSKLFNKISNEKFLNKLLLNINNGNKTLMHLNIINIIKSYLYRLKVKIKND
jgi:hypothetical protein